MSNLKIRVKNEKGEVVFGNSSPDYKFLDDSFSQHVCVIECSGLSSVKKPMPIPEAAKSSDLYKELNKG